MLCAHSCLPLCDPMEPTRLLCPWDFPGKHTGVGYYFLLQEIFPMQRQNLCLAFPALATGSLPLHYVESSEIVCVWGWGCAQSCSTLCNPLDYNTPDSSVHGVFQARKLGWVAISSSRGFS